MQYSSSKAFTSVTFLSSAIRARVIFCARTLELSLLVRPDAFFFYLPWKADFLVFLASYPEEEILNHLAGGPLIRALAVWRLGIGGPVNGKATKPQGGVGK